MKKLKEKGGMIRLILILPALGLLGLSYPYGSSSWFSSPQCFPLADTLNTSFFRCPAWYSNAVANLGIEPYCILEMDWAVNGHPERSICDSFIPSVQEIIERAGMSQSDTIRAKHYRLALFQYFWYTRWPTKNDSIWANWMGSYYRNLSNFGGTRPDYVELTNEVDCAHRFEVLRWLAFGFGRDSTIRDSNHTPRSDTMYLRGKFGLGNDTIVVRILKDNLIDSILKPFYWPDTLTEDSSSNGYKDTLCVCELYYLPDDPYNPHDTIYFTIPYNLKRQIIGLPVEGLDSSDLGFWTPKWYAKHVFKPVYDTLHNSRNIIVKYLPLSKISHDNYPMLEELK